MTHNNDYEPGTPAPLTGRYQRLTIAGVPAGMAIHLQQGDPLPELPRGFTWRFVARPPIADMSGADLSARAAEYRQMAATATSVQTRDALLRIARRFQDAAADRADEECGHKRRHAIFSVVARK
jgi:hypothetical protein